MMLLTLSATIAAIPLVTTAWLLVARETSLLRWDDAPLSGVVAFVIAWGPAFVQYPSPDSALIMVHWMIFGSIGAWGAQICLEDRFITRPEGVDPIPDRWPDWFLRGIWDEGEEARSWLD